MVETAVVAVDLRDSGFGSTCWPYRVIVHRPDRPAADRDPNVTVTGCDVGFGTSRLSLLLPPGSHAVTVVPHHGRAPSAARAVVDVVAGEQVTCRPVP